MENIQKKILVVEDDLDLQVTLVDRLNSEHLYQIITAADGQQAIELILDKNPDLILLDLMLPKLDGFEVMERLRSYPDPKIAAIKVIILSNLLGDKDILHAKALHIEGYYVKAHTNLGDVVNKINSLFKPVAKA
jgi:CheY-like chemotaxis protein